MNRLDSAPLRRGSSCIQDQYADEGSLADEGNLSNSDDLAGQSDPPRSDIMNETSDVLPFATMPTDCIRSCAWAIRHGLQSVCRMPRTIVLCISRPNWIEQLQDLWADVFERNLRFNAHMVCHYHLCAPMVMNVVCIMHLLLEQNYQQARRVVLAEVSSFSGAPPRFLLHRCQRTLVETSLPEASF